MSMKAPTIYDVDTLPEIAAQLGLTDEALYQLERRHQAAFPKPVRKFGKARVYLIQDVIEFHREVGNGYS